MVSPNLSSKLESVEAAQFAVPAISTSWTTPSHPPGHHLKVGLTSQGASGRAL